MQNDLRLQEHPWVIIGCGYTGKRLARRLLAAGARVWATGRSAEAVRAIVTDVGVGIAAHAVDLADAGALRGWMPAGAIVVDLAPPVPGAAAGEENLISAARAADARRIVYVSSTGVYPPGDGSWIDEDSRVGPTTSRGRDRLTAETTVLANARACDIDAVSLRVAGIYGPGRGVPARLHAGTYRIIGAGDTYVSRIHVDDLATVIVAAGMSRDLPRAIYNVADDEPETSRVYADAVADLLGVTRPPSVPVSAVDPWVAAMLGANRRISNAHMKQDLGVTLTYPTWREGLAQVMAEDGIPSAAERGAGAS